jgi:hypothetical protein
MWDELAFTEHVLCDYEVGRPRVITPEKRRQTANLIARVQDLEKEIVMDVASWKRSEHRLIKRIVLILIVAVAIGLLVYAALALVGLPCPNRYRTWLHESSVWIMKIRAGRAQSDAVGAAVACAYVTICATMRVRGRTALLYRS